MEVQGDGNASAPAKQVFVIAGITVNVYSLSQQAKSGDKPVAVMFLLHGRTGSAQKMEEYVIKIFQELQLYRNGERGGEGLDLYIATFVRRRRMILVAGADG